MACYLDANNNVIFRMSVYHSLYVVNTNKMAINHEAELEDHEVKF